MELVGAGRIMGAKAGQIVVDPAKPLPRQRQIHPEFTVPGQTVGTVETADAFEGAAPPEAGLLHQDGIAIGGAAQVEPIGAATPR